MMRPMTSPFDNDRLIPTAFHWGAYRARVRAGRLIALEPHPLDGNPSPIGRGMVGAVTASARVPQPMIRKGWLDRGPGPRDNRRGQEPFVAVSWEEALRLTGKALTSVRERYGNAAIFGGSYGWASAGRFHHANSQLHRFLNLFGGYTGAVNSYSKGALEVILPHVVGDSVRDRPDTPPWRDIAASTRLVVAFGGLAAKNTQVFAGGLVDHEARPGMDACRRAQVAFVNIGPQRDDIDTSLGARWIAIRPGTDAAVMLGLAHVLITEDLTDGAFLSQSCIGFDICRDYILGLSDGIAKTPTWAAAIAGCRAQDLIDLARTMAATRTLITVQWAVQRGDHGEQPCWLAVTLAAMAGSMGKPGGGVGFGYPRPAGATPPFRIAPLPQGVNAVRAALPVARLSDALLTPGDVIDYNGARLTLPELQLVYWAGGNPFHHHQDINKMVRAWQQPDTIIVHDPFWTAAARHADIVLPATTPLERNDFAAGNGHLMAMHRAIAPVGAARNDYDIFAALAEKLGFGAAFTEGRDEMAWVRHLYAETLDAAAAAGHALPDFDAFWNAGVVALPVPASSPPPFSGLRDNPGRHLLLTSSGKIELFSARIAAFKYDDCPGHGAWIAPGEWLGAPVSRTFPIHLISNQPRARLHGQYDHGHESLAGKIAGREPIRLHPDDANARGIAAGDVVRVFNDRGAFLAGAVVSDALVKGVAQIATGAWYDPLTPTSPGSLEVHGNPNVVTRDKGTSKLAQATSALSCLVEIEKFTGALPSVTAFIPPASRQMRRRRS